MKPKTPIQMNLFPTKLPLLGRGLGGGLLFLFLFCLIKPAHAQQADWQWIKRGGAHIAGNEREHVYDIATDSDRNVYVVSPIGVHDLDVDGHPKTYYGPPGGTAGEYVLASFSCDGSYRWSKIIGGKGNELPPYIEIDANDNLYIAGMFGSCNSQSQGGPPRIENDIILPGQTNTDCSLLYISKFDKNGNMLWFKRPMPQTTDVTDAYDGYSYNTAIDTNGNIYWLVSLPPGTYANGGFANSLQGRNFFILKYDPAGNFVNATHIDIQLSLGFTYQSIKMYRNPYNGYFYFTGSRASNESATIDGQSVTGSLYMACFDGQGNFQWMRQNTFNSVAAGTRIFSLEFDNQNNIYMGGEVYWGRWRSFRCFFGAKCAISRKPSFCDENRPHGDQCVLVFKQYLCGRL